jgi:hypothetical protein
MTLKQKRKGWWKNWIAKNREKRNKRRLAKARVYSRTLCARYRCLKQVAKKMSRAMNITPAQYGVLVSKPCFYCNKPLPETSGHSLDRLNNRQGYTFKNVVPCCKRCNLMRNKFFTPDEFKVGMKAFLKAIGDK